MLLDQRQLLVTERVALAKLTDTYDISDPATTRQAAIARDEPPPWAKWARLLVRKPLLPTTVNVYEQESMPPVLTLHKKSGLLRIRVAVSTPHDGDIGSFVSKAFSLGGGFWVHDANGRQVAEVKGDWKGWNFKFLDENQQELGVVTKKWAGIGKELFTTADTYMIALADRSTSFRHGGPLLLAAGLAIDIVFKERR